MNVSVWRYIPYFQINLDIGLRLSNRDIIQSKEFHLEMVCKTQLFKYNFVSSFPSFVLYLLDGLINIRFEKSSLSSMSNIRSHVFSIDLRGYMKQMKAELLFCLFLLLDYHFYSD
jgi:hypothetical protein